MRAIKQIVRSSASGLVKQLCSRQWRCEQNYYTARRCGRGTSHFAVQYGLLLYLRDLFCSLGGPGLTELNLSGCNIVSLPDDITRVFPALKTLHLRNCTKLQYLPWSLGSISSLQSVNVTEGCPELLYPPKSQQTDAVKTAKFLSQVHKQSEIWRRMKVLSVRFLLDTVFVHIPCRLCLWATDGAARHPFYAHWLSSPCSIPWRPLEA